MLEVLIDTIIDSVKLLPFLFIAYLILEYLEHKISHKSKEKIKRAGTLGPAIREFIWSISAMWIFSCSYKFLFCKSNYTRNFNFCLFIYI